MTGFDRARPLRRAARLVRAHDGGGVRHADLGVAVDLDADAWSLVAAFAGEAAPLAVALRLGLDAGSPFFARVEALYDACVLVPVGVDEGVWARSRRAEGDRYPVAFGFLGAGSHPEDADLVVVGAPWDLTGVRTGARAAPSAIRDLTSLYPGGADPLTGRHLGFHDLADGARRFVGARIADLGDIRFGRGEAAVDAYDRIARVADSVPDGPLQLWLGGDHAITEPILRGRRGPLAVLQIDAHTDCSDLGPDDIHDHGSVMTRVAALPHVVAIVPVGVREVRPPWWEPPAKVSPVGMRTFAREGAAGVLARLPKGVPVHLSIDVDGLDPSVLRGTATPVAGGLSVDAVAALLAEVAAARHIVSVDLVELVPELDPVNLSVHIALDLVLAVCDAVISRRG